MVQFFTHTSIDVQRVQEPDLDSTVVTTVYVCGQSIIQRTHAKQCCCLSEGSLLPSWRDRTMGVHARVGTAEGVPHPVETNRPSE